MASSRRLEPGKLPPRLLRELLEAAPALPPEVRIGPSVGEDACAIEVDAGTLVATTDPITLAGSDVARYAVAVNANDVAAMGVRPRWFLAAVLLPPGTTEDSVRELFATLRGALSEVGAALVGGHTEVTRVVSQPLIVGQMLGYAEHGRVLSSAGLSVGDAIVQVGRAPIEAAAVLAQDRAAALAELDPALVARARRAAVSPGISVVAAGLAAAELGACAAHDPTEGGIATGLAELAEASGVGLDVDAEAVLWFEPGVAVCRALGVDPWGALASGCLLVGFSAERVAAALEGFAAEGLEARVIARAIDGDRTGLPEFERDEVARLLG
jgi:hydrogenase maturation factor